MSDQPRNGRRIPARVVPVTRLSAMPAPVRRGEAAGAGGAASAARTRPYGAALAASGGFQRQAGFVDPTSVPGDAALETDIFGALGVPPVPGTPTVIGSGTDGAPESLILWEQPPQPTTASADLMPAWVSDPSVALAEKDFLELGAYVNYIVDGFADFCKAPGVTESGQWQARLDMPPAVLPDTVLDVQLSSLHVRLRFETVHRVSRSVLERYADYLQYRVQAALEDARTVEVLLW